MKARKRKWSALDDGLLHQTGEFMSEMGIGGQEPEWLKHHWIILVPPGTNAPAMDITFTMHPNQNLIHLQNLVVVDNVQYNLRGCRELNEDRCIAIHPVSETIVEPWRKRIWHRAESKDSPICFHLEVESLAEPVHIPKEEWVEEGLGLKHQWNRLLQPVVVKYGYIDVNDRSWHPRDYFGLHAEEWGIRGWRKWLGFLYATWCLVGKTIIEVVYVEEPDNWGHPGLLYGDVIEEDGERVKFITQVNDEWIFEKGTRDIIQAKIIYLDTKGKERELVLKRRSRGLYLGGGWLGERPGEYKGPYKIEMDVYDLNDQEMLLKLNPQMRDQYIECTFDGRPGYGILEYAISRKHPKYGSQL